MNSRPPLLCALTLYSVVGGIQRFNQRVVRRLAGLDPAGPTPLIHVLRDQPADLPAQSGIVPFSGSKAGFILRSLWASRRARFLLIDHIDLLPVAALVRLLRPSLPILMFAHGVEVWDDPAERSAKRYEPALLRFAVTRIACVSRYTAGRLNAAFGYPEDRIRILPNAVDPLPQPTADPGPSSPQSTVLTVTRLSAQELYKNVDKVIRAVARLAPTIPAVQLDIVGDGDGKAALMALAEAEGVSDRVSFLGRASDGELASAYSRASVFALPSDGEGFGIVYLEAWQRGLPVIGSTRGAAPEVIAHGHDGLLVESENVEMLADAIGSVLKDPEFRRRLGSAGRIKTDAHHSPEVFDRNLGQILAELTEEPRET